MESRHVRPAQRRPPTARSVSSNHVPSLPSRLSTVRSASHAIYLPHDGSRSADPRNTATFLSNRDALFAEPDVVALEDEEDMERPAKRAKTVASATLRAEDNPVDLGNDSAHQAVPGSPLPALRRQQQQQQPAATAAKNNAKKARPTAGARAARRANGLEPPPMATRLPTPRNVADFHPWNGHHPEDQLSETVIKAGYFDKPPAPNSTESNSAKPTIWPNLSQKNNMGLQTLSYLFTSVMEKRQAMGRCTAPSTFKPPPRVTVTDTKREAWLRDLANPDVPLRKQSRTIPHGIRGKLLMEQCLGKDIPMPRAVWLAKCVGANELRAFRRKGVSGAAAASGEQKWIREWTIAVELFMEGVVACCGQPEWQSKMDYATRLAASLYSERLLERDHYLDWIVASFAKSATDRLPVWIILIQLYWTDITSFGRRGRQLAGAILEILHNAHAGRTSVGGALRDRLRKLIMVMAVTHRGCLILPRTWEKYRYILAPKSLPPSYASAESPAHNIAKRNDRLAGPLNKTPENTRSAVLELYSILDGVGLSVHVEQLASCCCARIPNPGKLITALLEWSASVYRTGISRVYLAASLIARLAHKGADVDGIVLDFLRTRRSSEIVIANVHRVVSELVRLGRFSTGRYLQWLMVSGVLSCSDQYPLATGLLTALPLDAIPAHLENTRHMLMRRMGSPEDDVQRAHHLAQIYHTISSETLSSELRKLNTSSQLAFAQQAATNVFDWQWSSDASISVPAFCLLRAGLEYTNEITGLAKAITAIARTPDNLLLATLADTVGMNASVFAAIGCLQDIVILLSGRYKHLRAEQALDRICILSMKALVSRFPDMASDMQLLDNDLAICETQGMMAVCSPASDSLVNMSASHLDSDEDIDRVFESGNTMDEQLMQRLFSRIVQRANKPPQEPALVPSKICRWLNKLRALDTAGFDDLVKSYIDAGFKNVSPDSRILFCKVLSALAASMCVTLTTIGQAITKETQPPPSATVTLQLLISDAAVSEGLHSSEQYRFRVLRQHARRSKQDVDMTRLLALTMEDTDSGVDESELRGFALEEPMTFVACVAICTDNTKPSLAAIQNCQRLTACIVSAGVAEVEPDAARLVAQADPLSIMYCGAALSLHASTLRQGESAGDDVLQHAMLDAIKSGSEVWPQLLKAAGPGAIGNIYQWAKERVLNHVQQDGAATSEMNEVSRQLEILAVAFHAVKDDDESMMLSTIIEQLKMLAPNDINEKQLNILLALSTLFGTSLTHSTHETRLALLTALCTLLAHPALQNLPTLVEYMHDVAAAISDTIPSDIFPLLKTNNDICFRFIVGCTPSPDSWLALATNPQQQQLGSTQQQRALLKQQAGRQMAAPQSPQTPKVAGSSLRVPFPLRRWEVMPDATPTVGENDTSLSLGLFGARRV